jgi:hypothetical protein
MVNTVHLQIILFSGEIAHVPIAICEEIHIGFCDFTTAAVGTRDHGLGARFPRCRLFADGVT